MHVPLKSHLEAVRSKSRYLKAALGNGIRFQKNENVMTVLM